MGLPAGISGPKRQALKILSGTVDSLVGLCTDEGRNFEIILIVGKVFLTGIMCPAASTLVHYLAFEQVRRAVAVFVIPALHFRAA